jgi:CheY-like chemotaxis protein
MNELSVRVLVVDDDEVLAKCLVRALRSFGWNVDAVHDGQHALRQLATRAYDAALVDLHMPWGGGINIYSEACTLFPEMLDKIVFLSGGDLTVKELLFFASTPSVLLDKPCSRAVLREAIERVLAGGAPRLRSSA